jgi:hypothetical protein
MNIHATMEELLETVFSLRSVQSLYGDHEREQQAEVTQNHENQHVRRIGQGEARQKI